MVKISEARRKQLLELIEEWMDKQDEVDLSQSRLLLNQEEKKAASQVNIDTISQDSYATNEKAMFTVKELSSYLCVSQDCIYAMVREKQIPYVRVRRRILFHRDSIDSWLKTTGL
ncbi:excisionase family DNA-binding protein [Paenibacillus andongensis]|uniref:excisionase family DNA-binding protein n=1 Tax=Paenibacillus andongensis TaxID=2975482 RepID=UPI0034626880